MDGGGHRAINKRLILQQVPLFAGLSDRELALVTQRSRLVDVGKDEWIYREGDPPDAFYVLVTGRARIYTTDPAGREETLQVVHRGDYFGVISLLTQQPHSVSVKAVNDCILIKIRQQEFDHLLREIPQLAIHVSRTLSRRLAEKGRPRTKKVFESTIVSIYSAVTGIGRTHYAINLACSLQHETGKRVILVDMSPSGAEIAALLNAPAKPSSIELRGAVFEPTRVHQAIVTHPIGIATLDVAHDPRLLSNVTQVTPLLAFLAHEFHYVLVDLPREMDRTVFKGLLQADVIHLVTDARQEHLTATRTLIDELSRTLQLAEQRIKVIIAEGPDGLSLEEQTALLAHPQVATLPAAEGSTVMAGVPLVLARPEAGYAKAVRRIARHLGGVTVGLALGSGAAMGLAHIGVLRVLERERIPIDMVAGSSIGALVGALWTSGMNSQQLEQLAATFRLKRQTISLFLADTVLPPRFGFIAGHRVVRMLRRYLGDRTFRDLETPLRIAACDYANRQLVIFDEGSVVEAVRASISIPAIFVPHPVNGRYLIDGGILDPVPVDALLAEGIHKVIAVNALPSPEDIQRRHEELAAEAAARAAQAEKGRWSRFWYRLGRGFWEAVEPKIFDVIMHSMQAMEYILAEQGCNQADVSLHPTIPRVNWYEFYNVTDLICRGEEEAERVLPQIKQLVSREGG